MTITITIACIVISIYLLGLLAIIDMKTRLLPNKYVGGFFATGIVFNISTNFQFNTTLDMIIGMVCGGGLLLIVRHFANQAYKRDTLGLGDVKLMGAAGIWLGLDHIFLAISIGAFAGLIHGLIYGYYKAKKTGNKINLSTLSIPAGPGFIIGILITEVIKFAGLIM